MSGVDERPVVRVNQVGYLPRGPKRAVWISDAREPVLFRVRDTAGAAVAGGETVPWPVRPEPTSGFAVHVLDFSDLREGVGFTVEVDGALSHPFAVSAELYRPLARDALAFFYLQRCGTAIDEVRAPGYGRPAGHPGDVAVPAWTGEDADRLYPGWSCPGRFDVSGGWYDAGDHGKYVTSGALPASQLLATVELLRRRGARTSWSMRTESLLLEECRWQLDWLLRMQVPAGPPTRASPSIASTARSGRRCRAGRTWIPRCACCTARRQPRRCICPPWQRTERGVLRDDPPYARRLLDAATIAFRAAQTEPRLVAPDDQGAFGGGPYGDEDLADDLAGRPPSCGSRPATRPTGRRSRRARAERIPARRLRLQPGCRCRRAEPRAARARGAAVAVVAAADRLMALQAAQPWGQPYAPGEGWDWGSNGRILNNLVVLAVAHELTGQDGYLAGAARGMDYLLGCNALGQSYVTGYGTDCTRHQRTRHFARDLDPAFPPPPPGALAGGPMSKTYPGFPADPRLPACRRNAATSTSRRRRPPTTSASAGTPRSCSWSPGSRRPRHTNRKSVESSRRHDESRGVVQIGDERAP